jgi:hypothetical protein
VAAAITSIPLGAGSRGRQSRIRWSPTTMPRGARPRRQRLPTRLALSR